MLSKRCFLKVLYTIVVSHPIGGVKISSYKGFSSNKSTISPNPETFALG